MTTTAAARTTVKLAHSLLLFDYSSEAFIISFCTLGFSELLSQVLRVLLSTSMFVGGFVGILFDNTIPGKLDSAAPSAA